MSHSSCSIPEVPQPGVLVMCRLLSVSLGGVALGGGEEAGHQLAETVHPEHGETLVILQTMQRNLVLHFRGKA